MKSILAFDPGESTGWCFRDSEGKVRDGTLPKEHTKVAHAIESTMPHIVVIERFNLYPQMAKSLAWNSFYPCEVIGVIKLYAQLNKYVHLVEQLPSTKEYCGFGSNPRDEEYKNIQLINKDEKITEHVRDAYRLYRYWILFGDN